MAKRRKNKGNTPRHKRMNRSSRLQAAKHWVPKYEGKNLISGYSKHFAVDKLCAAIELEMLGYPIKRNYKKKLKDDAKQKQRKGEKRKKLKRKEQMEDELWEDSDETFAFIAGYTSGGAPYGITWEEWEVIEKAEEENPAKNKHTRESKEKSGPLYIDDDELPF